MRSLATGILLLTNLCVHVMAAHAAEIEAASSIDYLRDVKPLFVKHCYKCHSSIATEGDVRVDSHQALLHPETGIVVAGSINDSRIVSLVRGQDGLRMPPNGPGLDEYEVALIENWITQGAVGPPNGDETQIKHWAFEPPLLADGYELSEDCNIVDAIASKRHSELGLVPSAPAEKDALLRRLYLDLIGLPPTFEQLQTFRTNQDPEAYSRIVDELLQSPLHAERWARHWMDIWRYSDWDGFGQEIRESQPHIWRWRDWIVESLIADKPYSQMIVEMLAADEQPNATDDSIRATGFLVRNWYKFNRNTWIDNTVEHTSKAFMGITMNCARCHDHMYDPITQREYYQLRAFFEPIDVRTDRILGVSDITKDGLVRIYDKTLEPSTYVYARGNEKSPLTDDPVQPLVPKALRVNTPEIKSVLLAPEQYNLGRRRYIIDETRRELAGGLEQCRNEWMSQQTSDESLQTLLQSKLLAASSNLAAFDAKVAAEDSAFETPATETSKRRTLELRKLAARLEKQAAVEDQKVVVLEKERQLSEANASAVPSEESQQTERQKKIEQAQTELQDARQKLSERINAMPEPGDTYIPIAPTYPSTSTGRRTALASWITDRRHPLTARVAVNHVWMRHFGQPLVDSIFDFGVNGKAPSNQALLDALAVDFMDSGWSLKHLHRTIVTSKLYQQSRSNDANDQQNSAIDPTNLYLWKFPSKRIEAEVVRDSILFIAGTLDLTRGGAELEPSTADTTHRRSMYYRCSKEKRSTYISLFDGPNVVECYRRNESIVPQQALALMNSSLNHQQSLIAAKKLRAALLASDKVGYSNRDFIQRAYIEILSRQPSDSELKACEQFMNSLHLELSEQTDAPKGSDEPELDLRKAEISVVHVLFNHHDFVTIP